MSETAKILPASVDPQIFMQVEQLYARYAQLLDDGPMAEWPDMFAEGCSYRLTAHENYAAGLPLSTMAMDGVGMLRDRVHAATSTIYHQPYKQRHVIGRLLITPASDGALEVEANYAVFRTKRDGLTDVLNVGRYKDRLVRSGSGWLFLEKTCVFDSELIPNSIIYPV